MTIPAEPEPALIRCATCGDAKPRSKFYLRNKTPGRSGYNLPTADCKDCTKRKRKAWRDANRDLINERHIGYRLKLTFGLTLDEYNALLASQNGACAICESVSTGSRASRLDVDHDHRTGKIRGLLCNPCNPALGMFNEDAELLAKAAAYLEAAA